MVLDAQEMRVKHHGESLRQAAVCGAELVTSLSSGAFGKLPERKPRRAQEAGRSRTRCQAAEGGGFCCPGQNLQCPSEASERTARPGLGRRLVYGCNPGWVLELFYLGFLYGACI